MSIRSIHRGAALGALVLLLAAGCGDDDGDAGEAAVEAPRECVPVGTDLEADAVEVLDVAMEEYEFAPSTLRAASGVVTFATENVGEEEHELAFLPGGGDVPLDEDGLPDEAALTEAGAFELEAFGPGRTCNATYAIEPGDYTVFCIVRAEDGETHLAKGMSGLLTVS